MVPKCFDNVWRILNLFGHVLKLQTIYIFSAMFGIGHVSVYIQFVQSFKIYIDFLNNNSFCFMNQPKCSSTNGLTRSRPWYTHDFRTTVRMFQQISSTIVETNHHASKICKYKIIAEAFEQLLEQCRKRAPCFRFHLQGLFFPGSPFSVPGPVSGTWNLCWFPSVVAWGSHTYFLVYCFSSAGSSWTFLVPRVAFSAP